MRPPQFKASKDWDRRYLQLAELIAAWSKDPTTKVGAVCVRDRRILSTGYNGLPIGVDDSDYRLADRDTRVSMTLQAEANAITQAARNGISLMGSDLYIFPLPPSAPSACAIINAGIRRVVLWDFVIPARHQETFDRAAVMFSEAGVALLRMDESEEKTIEQPTTNFGSKIPPSLRDIAS